MKIKGLFFITLLCSLLYCNSAFCWCEFASATPHINTGMVTGGGSYCSNECILYENEIAFMFSLANNGRGESAFNNKNNRGIKVTATFSPHDYVKGHEYGEGCKSTSDKHECKSKEKPVKFPPGEMVTVTCGMSLCKGAGCTTTLREPVAGNLIVLYVAQFNGPLISVGDTPGYGTAGTSIIHTGQNDLEGNIGFNKGAAAGDNGTVDPCEGYVGSSNMDLKMYFQSKGIYDFNEPGSAGDVDDEDDYEEDPDDGYDEPDFEDDDYWDSTEDEDGVKTYTSKYKAAEDRASGANYIVTAKGNLAYNASDFIYTVDGDLYAIRDVSHPSPKSKWINGPDGWRFIVEVDKDAIDETYDYDYTITDPSFIPENFTLANMLSDSIFNTDPLKSYYKNLTYAYEDGGVYTYEYEINQPIYSLEFITDCDALIKEEGTDFYHLYHFDEDGNYSEPYPSYKFSKSGLVKK